MITTSLLLEWQAHPVTNKLFKLITEAIERSKEALANGATLGNNIEQRTSYYIGFIKALELIQKADLKEKEEENEQPF